MVTLPGSKSMTNRALVLGALAGEPGTVRRPLRSRDTQLMADGLRAMGTGVTDVPATGEQAGGGTDWLVTPGTGPTGATAVDVGNAGTVMRFLPPVAAVTAGGFEVAFDGDPRSRERPLAPLLDALRALGASIDDGGRGALPLTVRGGGLDGGAVTIDASSSSQLVSGLLLVGSRLGKGIEVRHEGTALPSAPHVAMTVAMLRDAGADVETGASGVWRVRPGPLAGREVTVEPDLSNAAPFLAAALVTGGRVTVPGWPEQTTQPGGELRDLLTRMGASCVLGPDGLTATGSGTVHGVDADLRDAGELTPTIAVLAALAGGPSRLRGVAHLRRHETDRLAALARELGNLGAGVRETGDGLEIRPAPLRGGVFHTYDDHRLATAAAVLGLAVPGVEVENVETAGKTLPGFTDRWTGMLTG